jgi:hypothetical protein
LRGKKGLGLQLKRDECKQKFWVKVTHERKLRFLAGFWIRIDSIRIRIRIRIHKVIESGSNPDRDTNPDPQQYFRRQIFLKI